MSNTEQSSKSEDVSHLTIWWKKIAGIQKYEYAKVIQ